MTTHKMKDTRGKHQSEIDNFITGARHMQLEIDGIGQQKAKLSDWKKDNAVFSHKSWAVPDGENPWNAWAGNPDPGSYLADKGEDAFGFGETEREAILNLCEKENIKPPFWWE